MLTLADLRAALAGNPAAGLHLMLPGGEFVPAHFHVTEVGRVRKDFLDCGGTRRSTTACVLQTWVDADTDHRLSAGRLGKIVGLADELFAGEAGLPVEVEYDGGVISQYPLLAIEPTPAGLLLTLGGKHTDCLAKDRCGVPARPAVGLAEVACAPGGGCC